MRALIAPMRDQIVERRVHLEKRLAGIARVDEAGADLAARLAEIEAESGAVRERLDELARVAGQVRATVEAV